MPALLFACVFTLLLRRLTDPDIWTHLTIGREVVHTGGVPAAEFYVAPLLGQPGHFNEWGFGVLHYMAHQAGGLAAMAALNAAVAAALFVFLFAILRRRAGGRAWAAASLVIVALWLSEFRLNYRPEMMLYLAAMATLYALERYDEDARPGWLLVLPAAAFALAQMHPSVLILLVFAGAHALDTLRRASARRRFPAILAAAATAALLACVNPYGVEQLVLPLRFVFDRPLLSGITELLPALQTEVAPRFVVAAVVGVAAFAVLGRETRMADALLFVLFAALAFRHARNVALFGLVAVLPAACALARFRVRPYARALAPLAAAAFAAKPLLGGGQWGIGVEERYTPLRSAQHLASLPHTGPVLGFFHLGNYLAWALYPRQRVIADARNFSFTASLELHDRLFRADPGWEQLLRQLGVSAIVTPMTMNYSGEFVPLAARLLDSADWRLAVREPAGLTFVPAADAAASLGAVEAWDQAVDELSENLRAYPQSATSRNNLELALKAREAARL